MLIKKNKIPILQIVLLGFWPSFIKKYIYKYKGYKIGKGVKFGLGSVIIGNEVSIGDYTSFGMISVVRGNTIKINRYVSIGMLTMIDTEKIYIDDDARINEKVIIGGIRNPDSSIRIGKRTIIMEYSFINPTKPIIIGDDSGIGGHCLLFTHGSWLNQLDGFPVTFAPITLGERVWLPWRVFIMPGTTIGNDVVIGANSLVQGIIPSNSMIAGSPAKVIKENYPTLLNNEKRAKIIESIFNDFAAYLTHNGIVIRKEDLGGGKFIITIFKEKKNIVVLLIQNSELNLDDSHKADVLVVDFETNYAIKNQMIMNLKSKTREGSNDAGEELAKFMSRYGIRLNRKD